jgi:hypothetical protein
MDVEQESQQASTNKILPWREGAALDAQITALEGAIGTDADGRPLTPPRGTAAPHPETFSPTAAGAGPVPPAPTPLPPLVLAPLDPNVMARRMNSINDSVQQCMDSVRLGLVVRNATWLDNRDITLADVPSVQALSMAIPFYDPPVEMHGVCYYCTAIHIVSYRQYLLG